MLGKDKDPKTESAIRDLDITPGMLSALKKQKLHSYLAISWPIAVDVARGGQRPADTPSADGVKGNRESAKAAAAGSSASSFMASSRR